MYSRAKNFPIYSPANDQQQTSSTKHDSSLGLVHAPQVFFHRDCFSPSSSSSNRDPQLLFVPTNITTAISDDSLRILLAFCAKVFFALISPFFDKNDKRALTVPVWSARYDELKAWICCVCLIKCLLLDSIEVKGRDTHTRRVKLAQTKLGARSFQFARPDVIMRLIANKISHTLPDWYHSFTFQFYIMAAVALMPINNGLDVINLNELKDPSGIFDLIEVVGTGTQFFGFFGFLNFSKVKNSWGIV